MLWATNAKNHIVAGEANLDHDFVTGHLMQKLERPCLVHHVNPVANTFRVSDLYRIAHMKLQVLGRNKTLHQFPSVKRDMYLWILLVQIVEDAHVEGEVPDGNVPVLRHHQV